MEFKIRVANHFWSLALILCLLRVCHGQLMCYVCDNCAQVTAETPQFECNEAFFNAGGPTDSSVQTTTELDETTLMPSTSNNEQTTVTATHTTTTTESKAPESSTKVTTELVTETSTETISETTIVPVKETTNGTTTTTTEEQPPSPPTVGPSSTVPTPPNPGTVKTFDDVETLNNQSMAHHQHVNKDDVENVDIEQVTSKAYKPSAEFRVRQLRSISNATYHCFKVHATVNGTTVVNRGCSRVQTSESVCGQWESQHPNEKMDKCYPCSRTKCNGTSALSVSITALLVAVVAVFMHRQ